MIELVIDQRRRDLGGFEVGRVLPSSQRHMVGPFIFFDHMGPVDMPRGVSRKVDVRPHPHINLATITYLFEGEIMHRDSVGSEQAILPGEVNWMIAGRGITHSERFERARREGDRLDGIQAWVALPREHEETEPSFSHHGADELPTFEERGWTLRVIAGELMDARAPVRTHSPLFYAHCELERDARARLPIGAPERAAYVARGMVEVGGTTLRQGQMALLAPGADIALAAHEPSTVMLLGGEPVGPRYIEWNFVSSSRDRIEEAKAEWRQMAHASTRESPGRFRLPDRDDTEWIPLPTDPPPAPNPMS